ncbi:unnamed protein product, partial [Meganyctiphanes norvegica]
VVVLGLVHGQGPVLTEALVAHVTLERLVFTVDVLVVPEVIRPPEGLTADVAGEGPLVRVGSLVDQEVVALGELPLAVLADVALLGPAQTSSRSHQEVAQRCRVRSSPK